MAPGLGNNDVVTALLEIEFNVTTPIPLRALCVTMSSSWFLGLAALVQETQVCVRWGWSVTRGKRKANKNKRKERNVFSITNGLKMNAMILTKHKTQIKKNQNTNK